jgi:hypothetical protein
MTEPTLPPSVSSDPDREPAAGTPRWVKVSGIVAACLVALVIAMLLSGHGPGRHMGHDGLGGHTAHANIAMPRAVPWR